METSQGPEAGECAKMQGVKPARIHRRQRSVDWLTVTAILAVAWGCDNDADPNAPIFPPATTIDISVRDIELTTPEDTPLSFGLTASSSTGIGPRILIQALPKNGRLIQTGNGFVYTPDHDFNGNDVLSYTGVVSSESSHPASATILVTPVNDAPAADSLFLATDQDTPLTSGFSAFDPEGDKITYATITPPTNGNVVVDNLFAIFTYTPNPGFVGIDTFYYSASDGKQNSSPVPVEIIVFLTDPPPLNSVTLQGGAPVTTSPHVQLLVDAGSTATQMRILGDVLDPNSSWRSFVETQQIELTPGDGLKTVSVQVRDHLSNRSAIVPNTILLDQTGPEAEITFAEYTSTVTVSMSIAVTDHSPPITMRAFGDIAVTSPDLSSFTPAVTNVDVELLPGEGPKAVTFEFSDGFGHVSTEAVIVTLDQTAPEGSLASAALFVDPVNPLVSEVTTVTNNRNVPLTLSWADLTSPVTAVVLNGDITNAGVFSGFNPGAATTGSDVPLPGLATLTAGDGNKLIMGIFLDAAGNASASFGLLVTLDTLPPALTSVSLAGGAPATNAATIELQVLADSDTFAMTITASSVFGLGSPLLGQPLTMYYTPTTNLIYVTPDTTVSAWVFIQDRAGNVTGPVGDLVLLDTQAPTAAEVTLATSVTTETLLPVYFNNVTEEGVVDIRLVGDFQESPLEFGMVAMTTVTLFPEAGTKNIEATFFDLARNNSSNAVTVFLDAGPEPPIFVTASAGVESVTVSWSAVSEAADYLVYYGTVSGGPYAGTQAAEGASPVLVGAPTTSLTLTGLRADVTIYTVISARDASINEGDFSSEVSASPLPDLSVTVQLPFMRYVTATRLDLRLDGSEAGANLGTAMTFIPDIDGDGYLDIVITETGADNANEIGRAFLYSSANFEQIGSITGSQFVGYGAAAAAAGDVNSDGLNELFIGVPDAGSGRVFAYSLTDLSQLAIAQATFSSSRFGAAMAHIDDINGDQTSDLLVGAPAAQSDRGVVEIRSGTDPTSVLGVVTGVTAGDLLGSSLVGLIDINSDTIPDFAVGAPGGISGYVDVYSGANQSLIQRIWGKTDGDQFGTSIAAVPNGAGGTGLLIGAPGAQTQGTVPGAAYGYDASTGTFLGAIIGPYDGSEFGAAVAFGDWSGDGLPNLVVGAPGVELGGAARGAVYIYNTEPLGLQARAFPPAGAQDFGRRLLVDRAHASAPSEVLLVGAPKSDAGGNNSGSAFVVSAATTARQASPFERSVFVLQGTPLVESAEARVDADDEDPWQLLGQPWQQMSVGGLTEGTHYAEFRGIDAQDRHGEATTVIWHVDLSPPETANITYPQHGATITGSTTVSGTVTDPVSNDIGGMIGGILWAVGDQTLPTTQWWDGFGFALSDPMWFFKPTTEAWTFDAPYATPGTYSIQVRGLDGAFQPSATATTTTITFDP